MKVRCSRGAEPSAVEGRQVRAVQLTRPCWEGRRASRARVEAREVERGAVRDRIGAGRRAKIIRCSGHAACQRIEPSCRRDKCWRPTASSCRRRTLVSAAGSRAPIARVRQALGVVASGTAAVTSVSCRSGGKLCAWIAHKARPANIGVQAMPPPPARERRCDMAVRWSGEGEAVVDIQWLVKAKAAAGRPGPNASRRRHRTGMQRCRRRREVSWCRRREANQRCGREAIARPPETAAPRDWLPMTAGSPEVDCCRHSRRPMRSSAARSSRAGTVGALSTAA